VSAVDSVNGSCTLRVALCESGPLTRRQVELPASITVKVQHQVIEVTSPY
jgi:hypothetical protein